MEGGEGDDLKVFSRGLAYLEEYVCEMSKHIRREVLVEEADRWYKLFDTAREQR